jgi:hypothetical protein
MILTIAMIKKLVGILILTGISFAAISQDTEPKKRNSRPDLPGIFTLELGLNRGLQAPKDFSLGFWGSRTINFYYQYEMRILKSRFSFVPGIGVSLERFKFKNGYILSYPEEGRDSVVFLSPSETKDIYPGLRKVHLVTNYLEMPLELRYSSKPDDPARSFKISGGFRLGYMYDAYNKLKYKENGEVKQVKDKQFYNLNRFRYGVYGRVGLGNVSLFCYYNLTPLFKEGKGVHQNGVPNDFNTMTIGLSLAAF